MGKVDCLTALTYPLHQTACRPSSVLIKCLENIIAKKWHLRPLGCRKIFAQFQIGENCLLSKPVDIYKLVLADHNGNKNAHKTAPATFPFHPASLAAAFNLRPPSTTLSLPTHFTPTMAQAAQAQACLAQASPVRQCSTCQASPTHPSHARPGPSGKLEPATGRDLPYSCKFLLHSVPGRLYRP